MRWRHLCCVAHYSRQIQIEKSLTRCKGNFTRRITTLSTFRSKSDKSISPCKRNLTDSMRQKCNSEAVLVRWNAKTTRLEWSWRTRSAHRGPCLRLETSSVKKAKLQNTPLKARWTSGRAWRNLSTHRTYQAWVTIETSIIGKRPIGMPRLFRTTFYSKQLTRSKTIMHRATIWLQFRTNVVFRPKTKE